MTDRLTYWFDSNDILNSEIADDIGSDLVEGSGEPCKVKILTHIFEKMLNKNDSIVKR